jgi:hypothetical protein
MLPSHKGRSKLQKPTFQNTAESKSFKHGTIESVQQGANYLAAGKLHHKTAHKSFTQSSRRNTPDSWGKPHQDSEPQNHKSRKTNGFTFIMLSKKRPKTVTAKTKIQSKSRKEKKRKKESAECN